MDSTPHGAAVTAAGFGLKGPRGWAFRNIDLAAGPGALIAVQGPSGSGRTCLLLALTGRMKPAEGTAEVGGLPLPKKMAAVRAVSALAHVPGVAELDPALTVGEHLRERALLQGRFGGSLRALLRPRRERRAEARALVNGALDAAGLDPESLPKGIRTSVRDLERLEALRLSVALAMVGGPRLLAVDDTDLKLSDEERAAAWAMLRGLAAAGTTVLAVCSEPPEGGKALGEELVLVRTGDRPAPAPESTAPTTPKAPTAPVTPTDTADPAAPADPVDPTDAADTAGAVEGDSRPAADGRAEGHDDEEGAVDAFAETGRA
ncbi:ATP-binding cassette domain-containing protein [Streptomyces sp. MOE7]|uniref:ATP-binding cassette domain-containing protein n=1 Tax=Streptomyces sp. MOE7 TaxID=1961713 RepID=UPI000A00CB98|nr:ATP-binding cassette domain-containing protein [Streptomyces sp. MOE7]ARH90805.1 ABC transporter ATP-binding protein [Streptomyces sp. MOE7]